MEPLINADEIKARIEATGLSLKEFCARAGIATTTIHRWHGGETEPQLAVYRRIIRALGEAENAASPSLSGQAAAE
jgi:predicted transcriptional regulator